MTQETPMMQQYKRIKAEYTDAFLFYRLGDFYELFFEDAVQASQELEITLTKRGSKGDHDIPMCGVPHHSAEGYISTLIEKGYKIAICEQVEDPKTAKGVVKREVVNLITPGTVMEGRAIHEKENNFIAAHYQNEDGNAGFVKADLTTGEIYGAWLEADRTAWEQEASKANVKELILQEAPKDGEWKAFPGTFSIQQSAEIPEEFTVLCTHISSTPILRAFGLLSSYLSRTQKRSLDHLQPIHLYEPRQKMQLDRNSRRNLELTETIRDHKKKGSLLWLMDQTMTAMGARRVKSWMEEPLLQEKEITDRQSIVQSLLDHFFERGDLRDRLKFVYDLERLAGKAAFGNVNARELVQMRRTLQELPEIISLLKQVDNPLLQTWTDPLNQFHDLLELLEDGLVEEPPALITEGGMFRKGFHSTLDEYREASTNGRQWISELERDEKQATGIKSLKVGFNRVFGYYIEVTKANIPLLPEGRYDRKQTLTNAERFTTPELKEKEALILGAQEKSVELEHTLFLELREKVKTYLRPLQEAALVISQVDVLQGFAELSDRQGYVRPKMSSDGSVHIKNGRHPVVEKIVGAGEYVANDVHMEQGRNMLLITGPNMSGKSTFMRQAALISIMSQTGCFVPAEEAELPIFDQVFTRIGAADDLASGQSTFMVEMLETNYALSHASKNSLILLDEIGRGTSTYDGMALAQAIIEYIHESIGAKTMFSTHYHELTTIADSLPHLQNVHVRAIEEEGQIVFLHKVEEGSADESYGIHVAKLADLPDPLLSRAGELLKQLEQKDSKNETAEQSSLKEAAPAKEEPTQLTLFQEEELAAAAKTKNGKLHPILDDIRKTDVLHLSPMEALEKLYRMQQRLR